METSKLRQYVAYSSLIHFLFFAGLIFINLTQSKEKHYYTVDFMASPGLPGGGATLVQPQPVAQKTEPEKVKVVNPEEDLLLKSKKKNTKEKEVISTVADIPSVPSVPTGPSGKAKISDVPGTVPGVFSGNGVGLDLGGGGALGTSGGNFPYAWYVQSVRKKLDMNWNVTSGFSQKTYSQIAFTISKNGSLKDIEVEQSSGNDIFDRAAVRAVEYSNPLPPLPSDYSERDLRVHVRFTLKR